MSNHEFIPMTGLYYAGIGSRETPLNICHAFTNVANQLYYDGWTLRSGGADGADAHFANGTTRKEIYIPWAGFNKVKGGIDIAELPEEIMLQARYIAQQAHPNWKACSSAARMLHTRNVFQIMGRDLKSWSKLVICWTKGGTGQGGTGQAIRIANELGVPVFDLGKPNQQEVMRECESFVQEIMNGLGQNNSTG
ncbi:hypothetical protein [Rhizobium phage RHph_X2_28B]|uniref:hypothetical protein n=1 Tax=Rhizobium phage RHph_X2_28B TaxID=2836086 RepID=UPI0023290FFA|nr:hypothetical protein PP751_gp020 [Rhizobium phage RHph_X2_28B]QWY83472.1 hypothetical protein [Rhizobium phage RHph_X2_28B]QWY83708.1 hypothetical protein [Rhizobium phage RHph_X3_15]